MKNKKLSVFFLSWQCSECSRGGRQVNCSKQ